MSDIFDKRGLRRVINVSGTETPFGAAPVRPEVITAINEIVPHSVLMRELQSAASAVRRSGCETEWERSLPGLRRYCTSCPRSVHLPYGHF